MKREELADFFLSTLIVKMFDFILKYCEQIVFSNFTKYDYCMIN